MLPFLAACRHSGSTIIRELFSQVMYIQWCLLFGIHQVEHISTVFSLQSTQKKSRNSIGLGRQRGRDLCESLHSISFCCIGAVCMMECIYIHCIIMQKLEDSAQIQQIMKCCWDKHYVTELHNLYVHDFLVGCSGIKQKNIDIHIKMKDELTRQLQQWER